MTYSFLTGLWKTVKNVAVVLTPAFLAGYAAFLANTPVEYVPYVQTVTAFVVYFIKNALTYQK